MKQMTISRRTIAYTAVLSALGFLLMILELPWPLSAWLKLDISDVTVLIGATLGGLPVGIGVAVLKPVLLFIFHGSSSAGVGNLAAIIASLSLLLPFYVLRNRSAIIAAVISVITLSVVMVMLNFYWITPFFARLYQMSFILDLMANPQEFLWWCISIYAPFNLAKGSIDMALFFLIARALPQLAHKVHSSA